MTSRKQSLAGVMLAGSMVMASLYCLTISKSKSHAQQAPLANSKPAGAEEIVPGKQPANPMIAGQYLGVAGCTAAACHGGPANSKTTPHWRSAYTYWFVNNDPHEAAYAVLKTERSQRIVWLLDQGHQGKSDDAAAKPWRTATPHLDNRCLTCHSIQPDAQATLSETLLVDGVSCEACHGPAQDWKGAHTTNGWANDPKRYQPITTDAQSITASTKMWNTKDPVSRAAICARCHVGGPDRDVNHDLLAAGHPRLNFEYAAFMQNYSQNNAHWDDKLDREAKIVQPMSAAPKPADHETRLWFIGQLTSLQASLKLLQQRVALAKINGTEPTTPVIEHESKIRLGHQRPAWPELSEFDCFACHHELNAESWRRTPEYRAEMLKRFSRKPGTIPWGTWFFNDVNQELLASKQAPLDWHGADQLSAAMEKLYQSRLEDIQLKIPGLSDQLDKVSFAKTHSPDQIQAYCKIVLNLPMPSSWDEAAQRYLALVAFNNSLESFTETKYKGISAFAKKISPELAELRKQLMFEENQDGPKLRTKADWQKMLGQFEKLKGLYNTIPNHP